MKDYNQEYFYVSNDREDIYPTLHYTEDGGNYTEVDMLEADDVTTERIMGFDDSTSGFSMLADFHDLKAWTPVISERLKNVLESFNLKETQFLPTLIRDDNDVEHDGYYIFHVYNKIKCMNWEESDWRKNRFNKEKAKIENLVLDNAKLDAIPLEERLVFKVWEDSTYLLFHQSVVEKMVELVPVPTGMYISGLAERDSRLPFIEEYEQKKKMMNAPSTEEFQSQLSVFNSYGPVLDLYLEFGDEAAEIGASMEIEVDPENDKAELQKALKEAKEKNWLDKLCLAVLEEAQSASAVMVCCLEMLKSNIRPDEARSRLEKIAEEYWTAERILEEWDKGNKDVEF